MHVTLDEMVCSDRISMLVLVDTGTMMEMSIFINSFPTEGIDFELFRTNLNILIYVFELFRTNLWKHHRW